MDSPPTPKLATPGAGLPRLELFILKGLFKTRLALGSPSSFNRQFAAEREKIRLLISGLSESEGGRQTLIRRPVGLEDSSRYWSVWMTLEHLRIMHKAIAGLARSLTAGVVPPGVASTAALKPQEGITSAIVLKYEASCDTVLKTLNVSGTEISPFQFAHPWFGPLTVRGWHAMAALHLGIHRRQIERILNTR